MKYHTRIREMRIKYKQTPTELAALLGITPSTYLKYETCANKMPGRKLMVLCAHYGVSSDYLSGLTDESKPLKP